MSGAQLEEALAALLFDPQARDALRDRKPAHPLLAALDLGELDEAAAGVRRMILQRTHRGTGGLAQWYALTLAGQDLDALVARFCGSSACSRWRESPTSQGGHSLEESFYRFLVDRRIGDPRVRENEFLGALLRTLAVTPGAAFAWPPELRPAPGGCYAISTDLTLHAALDRRYLRGAITPLLAALLGMETDEAQLARRNATHAELDAVTTTLRNLRLL